MTDADTPPEAAPDPAALLDLDAFAGTPLAREPYDHVIVPRFVRPDALDQIVADFPETGGPGSFPVRTLRYGRTFAALLDVLRGPAVRDAFAAKFGLDLAGLPTMITARGECRPTDGKIHTDSTDKVITVLIYLNQDWQDSGGRLRVLRSGADLEDYAAEAAPEAGSMLAFRRCDHSWHGHHPFAGPRRAIQLNWVSSRRYVVQEQLRHRLSAFGKRLSRRAARPAVAG